MAEGFQQSTDDIKHIANVIPGEDSDVALSGYVELYQLIALEKAIQDGKATSAVAKSAEAMVPLLFRKNTVMTLPELKSLQKRSSNVMFKRMLRPDLTRWLPNSRDRSHVVIALSESRAINYNNYYIASIT